MAKKKTALKAKKPARHIAAPARQMDEKIRSCLTLLLLVAAFNLLAVLIYFRIIPPNAILLTLVISAVVWCIAEMALNRNDIEKIKRAALVGLFLMVFDFMVENSGYLFGLWQTQNVAFTIGIVPIEIMLVCLIGGTAWALYLPKKYVRLQSIMDVLVFATYGMLGEHMLRLSGIMVYYQWWNALGAFVAYAITWIILHYVRYRVVKV